MGSGQTKPGGEGPPDGSPSDPLNPNGVGVLSPTHDLVVPLIGDDALSDDDALSEQSSQPDEDEFKLEEADDDVGSLGGGGAVDDSLEEMSIGSLPSVHTGMAVREQNHSVSEALR